MNKKENVKEAAVVETQRQIYEGTVVNRMNGRCGVTPKGAKGIALEIMDVDKQNVKDALNLNRRTQMTKQANAPQLDAVTIEKGKVVKRIQYKDTASSTGLNKTLNQVADSKYSQATLRGTKETAEAFNAKAPGRGINKYMESTGISTKDTTRVADKYLATSKGMTPANIGANIGNAAKTSAIGAAGLTAAIEVGKGIINRDDVETTASNVVSKGSESVVSGLAAGAAGEVAFIGTALVCPPLAVPAAIVSGIAAGTVAGDVVEGAFDGVGEAVGDVVGGVKELVSDIGTEIFSGISYAIGRWFW